MARTVTISLDAMGGDHGPGVVVPGAALALERHPDARFIMFGNEAMVAPILDAHPKLKAATTLVHTDIAVSMDAKPSQALRQGRYKSSMWKAIEAVKTGEAAVCVSAGNTGALGAMSRFCLRSMANVERPALACLWPTLRGESVVLDVGATIGADAGHLVDLAVMGAAMAHVVLNIERPSVGLLNVGVEEIKGNEEVKVAGQMLRELDLPLIDYRGYVEGDDLGKGTVDVVVTEGFTGNIALKTAEGTAKQIGTYLKTAMTSTLFSKIGYLFARSAFSALKDRMDPRKVNGGVFLGLEGIVIKSHGGTDAIGFSAAIDTAYDMASHDLMAQIRSAVAAAEQIRPSEKVAAEAG